MYNENIILKFNNISYHFKNKTKMTKRLFIFNRGRNHYVNEPYRFRLWRTRTLNTILSFIYLAYYLTNNFIL